MCEHIKPPTYWHVYDHDTGETISTYTTGRRAFERAQYEADNGRHGVRVHKGQVAF